MTPSSLRTSTAYLPCMLQQCALDARTSAILLLKCGVLCMARLGLTVTWVPLPINVADAETWKGVALRCTAISDKFLPAQCRAAVAAATPSALAVSRGALGQPFGQACSGNTCYNTGHRCVL